LQRSGELLQATVLEEPGAREADAAVAVVVDTADEAPNCGTACVKPASERIAAEAVNNEVSISMIYIMML